MSPSCPYCRRNYRYKDTIRIKGKVQVCRHCKKKFEVQRRYQAIPVVIACIVMTAVNLICFYSSRNIAKSTFIILTAADAAVILLSLLISPLFIRFVKKR